MLNKFKQYWLRRCWPKVYRSHLICDRRTGKHIRTDGASYARYFVERRGNFCWNVSDADYHDVRTFTDSRGTPRVAREITPYYISNVLWVFFVSLLVAILCTTVVVPVFWDQTIQKYEQVASP